MQQKMCCEGNHLHLLNIYIGWRGAADVNISEERIWGAVEKLQNPWQKHIMTHQRKVKLSEILKLWLTLAPVCGGEAQSTFPPQSQSFMLLLPFWSPWLAMKRLVELQPAGIFGDSTAWLVSLPSWITDPRSLSSLFLFSWRRGFYS